MTLRESCTKELPKALASFGHDWLGGTGERCAYCNVDRTTAKILSAFRLSPDAFATEENKPMKKPIPQKRDALETLRRVLAASTDEQQVNLARLLEVEPDAIRRAARRARSELKPRHDVLGDMRAVLERHEGLWTIWISDRCYHVCWESGGHRAKMQRGVTEGSLEQTVSLTLDFIESFTREDGGLDL